MGDLGDLEELGNLDDLDELGDLIRTGPTNTNVGDLQIILAARTSRV